MEIPRNGEHEQPNESFREVYRRESTRGRSDWERCILKCNGLVDEGCVTCKRRSLVRLVGRMRRFFGSTTRVERRRPRGEWSRADGRAERSRRRRRRHSVRWRREHWRRFDQRRFHRYSRTRAEGFRLSIGKRSIRVHELLRYEPPGRVPGSSGANPCLCVHRPRHVCHDLLRLVLYVTAADGRGLLRLRVSLAETRGRLLPCRTGRVWGRRELRSVRQVQSELRGVTTLARTARFVNAARRVDVC